jgi:hypothetical protein
MLLCLLDTQTNMPVYPLAGYDLHNSGRFIEYSVVTVGASSYLFSLLARRLGMYLIKVLKIIH